MQNSNDEVPINAKLQITFPKSSEDHRLQLVHVNGAIFAILHSSLDSNGPINLQCEDWSLILLAPIKSKTNIEISAINVICLNEIESEDGEVYINASNRLVKLTSPNMPPEKLYETGKCGKFQLEDEGSALINYFQLFYAVVNSAHEDSKDSFVEAQKKFITCLCTLASRMEGANLNIHRILGIWDIPSTLLE